MLLPVTLPANGWRPRPHQLPFWSYMEHGGRRAIAIWHRRAGKDEVCLHRAAVAAHERPATYWHMLPEYAQGRKAIWSAVNPHTGRRRIDEAFPKELRAGTNEQEMFIRFRNGSTWQVVGSDRYDATVGSPPAGVTFSEWALANPASWGYLAPILVENNGWAAFITTSRGRNHAKSMLDTARRTPGWFAEILTVDDTKLISPSVIEGQRAEYHGIFGEDAGDALIEQEYYCSFEAAVLGSYWGKELARAERESRITRVDVDRNHPVHVAWDIGIDDPMALWCFQVGHGFVNVVDYYESSGHGFEHYCDWLKERDYRGIDWVPHDAKQREVGNKGRTRIQSLIELGAKIGRKPKLVPKHKLMDGINAGRQTIPKARFDAERCAKGLEALREYKAEWDQDARTFKRTPAHNWASHAADSWRYLSMSWTEPVAKDELPPMRGIESMSINDVWRLQPQRAANPRI